VTRDSGRAVRLEQACSYLRGADPVLARLINARPDFDPRAWLARLPPMDLLGALLFQLIGQQVSVAATRRTVARIGALFDGHLPAPAGLLAVDPAKLREAGLSWRKIGTLRDVAERLSDGRLDQAALSELLTIAGQIVAGTSFDPERVAERYWQVVHADGPWEAEIRFTGESATSYGSGQGRLTVASAPLVTGCRREPSLLPPRRWMICVPIHLDFLSCIIRA
jgi:hypothetical protein